MPFDSPKYHERQMYKKPRKTPKIISTSTEFVAAENSVNFVIKTKQTKSANF